MYVCCAVPVLSSCRYADLAIQTSIQEVDWAVDRIREGLAHVVSHHQCVMCDVMQWPNIHPANESE